MLLVALLGQWLILEPRGSDLILPIFRTVLYIAATVFLIYDWRVVWPRTWKYRQEYLDHADEPEIANPASTCSTNTRPRAWRSCGTFCAC